jgi:O-antigen ligase
MSQGLVLNVALMVAAAAFAVATSAMPAATMAAAGGLLLCAGAARRFEELPKFGLLAVTALVPLSYLGTRVALGTLNSLTKLVFLPALAVLLADRLLTRRPLVLGRIELGAALFALTLAVSYLLNEATPYSFLFLARFAGVLLLFFLTANALRSERDLQWLLGVIAGSCLLSAAGALVASTPAHVNGMIGGVIRMTGWSWEDAPTFGTNLLVALLICLYGLLSTRRNALRLALIPAVGFLLMGIVLTYARGVSVATAVAVAYLLFRVRRRISGLGVLGGLVVAAACGALLIPDAYWDRMTTMFTQSATDPTMNRRWDSYRIGLHLFQDHWLFGLGPGNFLAQYMSPEFRFDRSAVPSVLFNLYLSVATQAGLLGLLALAAMVWFVFGELRFVRRSFTDAEAPLRQIAEVLEIVLVALLLISMFEPTDLQKYIWIAFGAAAAAGHIRRAELAAADPARLEAACSTPP